MTVLECKIQRGSIRHTNGQGTGSSSVVYVIDTNDNSAGPLTVRTEAQTLPGLQDTLPVRNAPCVILGDTDGTIYVQSISMAQQDQPSTRWLATVQCGKMPPNQQPGSDPNQSPLEKPAVAWIEYSTISNEITQAWNVGDISNVGGFLQPAGQLGPIINSANKVYSEALYEDRRVPTIVIQKNANSWQEIVQLNNLYDHSLNDAPMFGGDVGLHCARYDGASCNAPQIENGVTYYSSQIRITFSESPWTRDILNQGFEYYVQGDDGWKLQKATDDDGDDATDPALLTADGQKLGEVTGNFIEYRTRREVDYSALEGLIWSATP